MYMVTVILSKAFSDMGQVKRQKRAPNDPCVYTRLSFYSSKFLTPYSRELSAETRFAIEIEYLDGLRINATRDTQNDAKFFGSELQRFESIAMDGGRPTEIDVQPRSTGCP